MAYTEELVTSDAVAVLKNLKENQKYYITVSVFDGKFESENAQEFLL